MAGHLSVHELARDQDLGVIRKQVTLPGGGGFESPSRSISRATPSTPTDVNEITRQINSSTITSLESVGTAALTRDIRSKYIDKALNLVVLDLKFDQVPSSPSIRTLSQFLYAVSDRVVMIPTVKSSMLKESPKFTKYSDSRIKNYIQMTSDIIDQIELCRNGKAIMGTIPLMPIKFSREILRLYFEKGIEAFAIDAGTKDIINNEADFRLILSEINGYKSLSKVFLYACNLGYSLFEKTKTRADDFLGFFAYVDVLGGTFKTRGGPPMGIGGPPRPQRAKIFSRDEYAYEIFSYQEASQRLGHPVSPTQLQAHNQESQRLEANHVRSLVGQEPIKSYVTTKPAVDATSMKRLESIAKGITPP